MNGAPAAEESSGEKSPEEILAADAKAVGEVEEVSDVSTEEIADAEEAGSESDAFSDADAREEAIELENDAVDSLVNESQEVSDEGIDDGWKRSWLAALATYTKDCRVRRRFQRLRFRGFRDNRDGTDSYFDEADMSS